MPIGLIVWIIGIPVAIWRPRKAPDGSPQARAYGLIRWAAALLLASYLLLVLPDSGAIDDSLPLVILALTMVAATLLWPIAMAALALDMRRRWMALPAIFIAGMLAMGLSWLGLLTVLLVPGLPAWRVAAAAVSTLLALGADVCLLELYALIRRPDRDSPE